MPAYYVHLAGILGWLAQRPWWRRGGWAQMLLKKLHQAMDLSLRATKETTSAICNSMAALVVTERQFWLNLSGFKEKEKAFLLEAPLSLRRRCHLSHWEVSGGEEARGTSLAELRSQGLLDGSSPRCVQDPYTGCRGSGWHFQPKPSNGLHFG